jgi:hypothetical protein
MRNRLLYSPMGCGETPAPQCLIGTGNSGFIPAVKLQISPILQDSNICRHPL